jgi:porphobilinogen deaminase
MDLKLSESGETFDKGLFTKELEEALLRGEVDVAVHALKDLATELPSGLELIAVLPRHDPVDVLVSKTGGGLNGSPQAARSDARVGSVKAFKNTTFMFFGNLRSSISHPKKHERTGLRH